MKKSIINRSIAFHSILLFIVLSSPQSLFVVDTDEDKVIECYEKYKAAILNDRGIEAIKYIDSKTIDYYSDILDKALYADKDEVTKESLVNKLAILRIRHEIPLVDLRNMNGSSLVVYSINNAWVGKNAIIGLSVRNIKIESDFATANVYKDNKNIGLKYRFYNEEGQWKFNFIFMLELSNLIMKQQLNNLGYENEDDFIFDMLEAVSGKKVTEEIFNPLLRMTCPINVPPAKLNFYSQNSKYIRSPPKIRIYRSY